MKNNNKIVNYLSIALTTFIGVFFVLTGFSKFFEFNEFSNSIGLTISFFSNTSYIVAIIVILGELILGYLFLRRKHLDIVSILLSILSLIFIVYLILQIINDSNASCICYGILGLEVTAITQIIIDIFILNSCVVVYVINSSKKHTHAKSNMTAWIVSIVFFVFMQYSIINFVFNISSDQMKVIDLQIENVKIKSFTGSNNTKVIFYVDFDDFSCALCYDDFTILSDYLNETKIENLDVLYLFSREKNHLFSSNSKRLEVWAKVNNIGYQILYVDSLLQMQLKSTKSSVYLFSKTNSLQYKGAFPIGITNRKFITNYLAEY